MWPIEKILRRPELPTRIVTTEEFVRAMTERGESLAEAELQAKICKGLGSEVLVGDEYLRIKP